MTALTDAALAELTHVVAAYEEARRKQDAVPVFVTGEDGRRYVNTGREVTEVDCELVDAQKAYERAMAFHGVELLAEVRRLRAARPE